MNFNISQHRSRYLELLFGGLDGSIEVRSFAKAGNRVQTFCSELGMTMAAIQRDFEAHSNVYVGMATRGEHVSDETGRRSGGKDNLVQCRALWVDRDGLTEEGAREEWEFVLESFPFPPSMRVDSGGGEHAYWILDEPVEFNAENMLTFEHTLKGLADLLGCDMSATDASRILRVPGTVNLPNAEKRLKGRIDARCRILSLTEETYSLDDFADLETRGAQVKSNAPPTTANGDWDLTKFRHPQRHEALTRHAAFLRKSGLSVSACEAALLVFNAERCDPPKEDAEVWDIARWSGCIDIGEHTARDAEPRVMDEHESHADWMRRELIQSLNNESPIESMNVSFKQSRLSPRYLNSVEGLETYGNTVLLSEAGVGKSMLAIGMAIEAATCDWEVVYFNAELDSAELSLRIYHYGTKMRVPIEEMLHHTHWFSAGDGTTREGIVQKCVESVKRGRKLLIVLDSVNTLAEFAASDEPGGDLAELRRLYNWSTQVRKNTLGDVAFLIVSETNASGGVKGRKGNFSADVVVHISKTDDPELVNIDVTKSRSAMSGPLGMYFRDWKTGRFTK